MLRAGDPNPGAGGIDLTRKGNAGMLEGPLSPPNAPAPGPVNLGGGAGGPNVAVIGTLPPGAIGCPPNCSSAGGRASVLSDPNNRGGIVTFEGGGGGGGNSPYQFKFATPPSQAFASLGPLTKPDPAPGAPVLTGIPSIIKTQPIQPVQPVQPPANLGSLNAVAGSAAAKSALGTVGGLNSGMGAGAALKSLNSLNSVNTLMPRQKN
jgi:hypothetical protein